jgi:hypothetical protein
VSLAPDGRVAAAGDQLSLGPGSVLKQYEPIRELGRGGMGRVFLARDTRLARLCAIKLLLGYSGERAERFLSEARATARCKHESIVVISEVDEHRGFPYMEWSPDGRRIATASSDTTLRIWEPGTGHEPRVLRGHEQALFSVEWSPDGRHIATGSDDETARIWDVDATGEPRVLRGHTAGVNDAACRLRAGRSAEDLSLGTGDG